MPFVFISSKVSCSLRHRFDYITHFNIFLLCIFISVILVAKYRKVLPLKATGIFFIGASAAGGQTGQRKPWSGPNHHWEIHFPPQVQKGRSGDSLAPSWIKYTFLMWYGKGEELKMRKKGIAKGSSRLKGSKIRNEGHVCHCSSKVKLISVARLARQGCSVHSSRRCMTHPAVCRYVRGMNLKKRLCQIWPKYSECKIIWYILSEQE